MVIADIEKEIICGTFKRIQCKDWGIYEESFCWAFDGKVAKNSEDECVYDGIEFL
jgi:hypothetical protein